MPTPREGPQAQCPRGPVARFHSVGKIAFEVDASGSMRERDFANPTTVRNPCIGGNLMTNHLNISRRQMLAMSAAAGGLAASGIGRASAQQPVKRIEQFDPALEKIISTTEPINSIADGMGGPLGPVEGPVWWKEGGYLLFSDIHASKRMKYAPGQGVTVFQEKTNQANGLTRDLQGRLIACEHETRRVIRQELDGSITVIANSFQGRRLNRPNDVVVKSDGSIYFTDPWTSPDIQQQWDMTFMGVYRVTPDLGTMTLLVDDFLLRSEEHTSELQSHLNLVCRLLLEKKKYEQLHPFSTFPPLQQYDLYVR